MSEDWSSWRQALDFAAGVQAEMEPAWLQQVTLCGVNGWELSSDLWSFLTRWIGPHLYQRGMRMGQDIEGHGPELWRKLPMELAGSDKLVQIAGRTRLQEFGQCKSLKNLDQHIEEWLQLFYQHGEGDSSEHDGKFFSSTIWFDARTWSSSTGTACDRAHRSASP